jgi:hypothetical protein
MLTDVIQTYKARKAARNSKSTQIKQGPRDDGCCALSLSSIMISLSILNTDLINYSFWTQKSWLSAESILIKIAQAFFDRAFFAGEVTRYEQSLS